MKILVSFDPGLRESGIAEFADGVLRRAALIRNPEKSLRGPQAWMAMAHEAMKWFYGAGEWLGSRPPDVLVVEFQQVYRRLGGDPADLLELAGVNGAVCYAVHARAALGYLPKTWKGQVPQKIFSERIGKRLTEAERAVIEPCPASLLHNVHHAIGLGWYHLGKL